MFDASGTTFERLTGSLSELATSIGMELEFVVELGLVDSRRRDRTAARDAAVYLLGTIRRFLGYLY